MNAKDKFSKKLRGVAGKFLRGRRQALGQTMAEIAVRGGVPSVTQMTVHKIERGTRGIKLSEVRPLSVAYGLDVREILKFTGHSEEEFNDYLKNVPPEPHALSIIDPNKLVTTDDLKFLVGISEGLVIPLNLGQVVQLLNSRH